MDMVNLLLQTEVLAIKVYLVYGSMRLIFKFFTKFF